MSKIDLSKAKIGDKFRTKNGLILTYCKRTYVDSDFHILTHNDGSIDVFYKNGNYLKRSACGLDLAEQVFDKPLDELIEEGTKRIKENDDAIAEEKELQRRQEVVELAEKLVVNEEMMKSHKDLFEAEVHNCAKTLTTYTAFVIRSAEDFIKHKNQYLKDGKL